MEQMNQSSGVVGGVGCYACGAQAIGQCKNDGQFYCAEHGDAGYCAKCIEQAHATVPNGVGCAVQTLWGLAVLLVLLMIGGGAMIGLGATGWSFGSMPNASNISAVLLGAVVAGIVYTIVVGLPLFYMGRALKKGSTAVRTTLVIIAWILVLLIPTVIGPIIGGVILFMLNQQPTRHWFEMRKIQRVTNKSTLEGSAPLKPDR